MAEDYGAQASVKYGNGNMVNIRAENVDGLVEEMGKLNTHQQIIVAITEEFQALATINNTMGTNIGVTQEAPADPNAPTCAHGKPRVWKDFTSKKGNRVKGWFCTVESDPALPACAAQFAR